MVSRTSLFITVATTDKFKGRSALSKPSRKKSFRTFASENGRSPFAGTKAARRLSPHVIAADASEPVDATSGILDSLPEGPTARTRALEDSLNSSIEDTKSLQASLNAHISSVILSLPDEPPSTSPPDSSSIFPNTPFDLRDETTSPYSSELPPAPFSSLQKLYAHRKAERQLASLGTSTKPAYTPNLHLFSPPSSHELTLRLLLTAQSHLGHATSLWNPRNSAYIFGIRDGIHIIALDATFSYLRRAARIVTEIARRGGLILFVGTRDGHEDIVVNAAKRAGGYHVFDRWTPGSLTNGQQILGRCAVKVVDVLDRELPQYSARMAESAAAGAHPVLKPDLVICLNPLENEVCLHECGLYNVPTIGIIDTDADPSWVTYPIPANDDSLRCVMLVAGVLGRAGEEGKRIRLQEAENGKSTYSTKGAELFLKGLDELKGLASDAQDNSGPTT
jgi:small subunit ribosomal protein S2